MLGGWQPAPFLNLSVSYCFWFSSSFPVPVHRPTGRANHRRAFGAGNPFVAASATLIKWLVQNAEYFANEAEAAIKTCDPTAIWKRAGSPLDRVFDMRYGADELPQHIRRQVVQAVNDIENEIFLYMLCKCTC